MRRYSHIGTAILLLIIGIHILPSLAQEADARKAIPGAEAQKQSMELVKEVYQADFKKATTPEAKIKLAGTMLNDAKEFKGDDAGAYVILRVARDMAAGAGSIRVAALAIDQLAGRFAVDGLEMKLQAAIRVAKEAKAKPDRIAVAQMASPLIAQAVAADKYDLAIRAARGAEGAARRAGDLKMARELSEAAAEVESLAARYRSVAAALEKLKQAPTDGEANETVGRHKCFVKGDWRNGVPHLALATDAVLRKLAIDDFGAAKDPLLHLKVADAWWEFSQNQAGTTNANIMRRAAHWYTAARPNAKGLVLTKIDKRLKAIAAVAADAPARVATQVPAAVTKVTYKNVKSERVGGRGGKEFQDLAPGRAYLVGFRVALRRGDAINALQPIYRRGTREYTGRGYGRATPPVVNLVARKNYAVGQVKMRSGLWIDGIKLVYMRVTEEGLDPTDTYESQYIGGRGGGERSLTSNGNRIVGIHGFAKPEELSGFGLIVAEPENPTAPMIVASAAAAEGWTVLFRSANPTLWNTDYAKGEEVAVKLEKAPAETRYLRMTMLGKKAAYVIIPMRKDQLANEWKPGQIGWNGSGRKIWGGHHLGVIRVVRDDVRGEVHVAHTHRGWGFGHINHGDDSVQGYTWGGRRLPPTAFEIAVKTEELTSSEKKYLLRF